MGLPGRCSGWPTWTTEKAKARRGLRSPRMKRSGQRRLRSLRMVGMTMKRRTPNMMQMSR